MATIEKKTVQCEQLVVNDNNNVAPVDDVINVLTVVLNSEKRLNFFDKPEATKYLKAAGIISEREPNMFSLENRSAAEALSDQLSNTITDLITHYSGDQPAVKFNSASVEEK